MPRSERSQPEDDDDVLGGMPRQSGDDDERSPLGVPKGYKAPAKLQDLPGYYPHGFSYKTRKYGRGAEPSTIREIGARYYEGYQFRPASTSPASIAKLQANLAAAGLLEDFRVGVWDKNSQKAYAELLSEANAAGITWEMALKNRAQSFSFGGGGSSRSGGGGGGGRWVFDENGEPVFVPDQYVAPPLTLRTTNREDLARALRTGIIDKMGVGWNQAQINELADLYIQQEIKAQTDAYNQQVALERQAFEQGEASVSGQTITEVSVPSPETFMENELMRRDPVGYQAAGVVNEAIPQFMAALRGWV